MGSVRSRPLDNTNYLILPRIGLGMLNEENYKTRWNRKRVEYQECVIGHLQDGGDQKETLIETHDEPGGKLDSAAIVLVTDRVILG